MRRAPCSWNGTDRLRAEAKGGMPKKVTAFHAGMAVHGRHGQLCPVCGTEVQRIVKGESESNYARVARPAGAMLADRALSNSCTMIGPKRSMSGRRVALEGVIASVAHVQSEDPSVRGRPRRQGAAAPRTPALHHLL